MTEEIKYPCEQIAKNIISKFTVIPLSSMVLLLRTELREAYLAGRADALKENIQREKRVSVLKMNNMKCPKCLSSSNLLTERRPEGDTKCLSCGFVERTALFYKVEEGNIKSKNEFFKNEGFSNE